MRIKLNIFNLEISNEPKAQAQPYLILADGKQVVSQGQEELNDAEYDKLLFQYIKKNMPAEPDEKIKYFIVLTNEFESGLE
jgi:hypothetical protein